MGDFEGPPFYWDNGDPSASPQKQLISDRSAFYQLINIDEHPEVLPMAYDFASERLNHTEASTLTKLPENCQNPTELMTRLANIREEHLKDHLDPILTKNTETIRRVSKYYLSQFAPTALVDGCWLQSMPRVATAHTQIGARMSELYEREVCALSPRRGHHFTVDYRELHARLGDSLPDVSERLFSESSRFDEFAFELPIFLLSIGQFPRTFLPEILGIHLACLGLRLAFLGQRLMQLTAVSHGLPMPEVSDDSSESTTLAAETAEELLESQSGSARNVLLRRICSGAAALVAAVSEWFKMAQKLAPIDVPDLRQETIEILARKAPHAYGYHGSKKFGDTLIDDFFTPGKSDLPGLLDALAKSRLVKPGQPEKSYLVNGLVAFGGPMFSVFSDAELAVIRDWIRSLQGSQKSRSPSEQAAHSRKGGAVMSHRPIWSRTAFRHRSQKRFGNCSTRMLYHYLVNVEQYPDILPIAEQFARKRLKRSTASLHSGKRPIPSKTYSHEVLENWVYRKHREQVDSYHPLNGDPPLVSREAFIESTTQLAPLILIDGSWLQGVTNSSIIHTDFGRRMFRIFYEEIGEGNAKQHHANIFRELLAAMGEYPPPVETIEFAQWNRLRDKSFEIPALWLSISCFPKHYTPEILGLNLAVELAGVGGPYMQACDTLRYYGLPTLFVDVHNAADNISNGHAGQSVTAIKKYMDKLAARDGPHNLDLTWLRIWSGVAVTTPHSRNFRWFLDHLTSQIPRRRETQTQAIF